MTEAADPGMTSGSQASGRQYVLWLFVAGDEPNSRQARQNLEQLCEKHLDGRYQVVIYNVLQDFQAALQNRVLVTPTLIRVTPLPRVTIFGNLSDTPKVLAALQHNGGG